MQTLINGDYKPDALVSIFVNEDKKIEESHIIEILKPEETGRDLYEDCGDWINQSPEFFQLDIKPNTLYHAYFYLHYYECGGYEYTEWDMEPILLGITEVMSNYRDFIEKEKEYLKQEELKFEDGSVEVENSFSYSYLSSMEPIQLTRKDFQEIIKIVAEKDLRLAHRISTFSSMAEKTLLDKFNKEIMNIEALRWKFKNFIKNNSNLQIGMTDEGYMVKNKSYSSIPYGAKILISHKMIDNLEDDILLTYSCREILEYLYSNEEIMNIFSESEA